MDDSSSLHSQAIAAALAAKWEDALKLNQQILSVEPQSVDAINRLARAHFELGNLPESKKNYQKSLSLDPFNQIAFKFLKRIEAFTKAGIKNVPIPQNHINIGTDLFIEEPGKTKIVPLLKVAEPQRLSLLVCGEMVNLVAKNRGVVATDQLGKYLGILPDDLSKRLIRLMHGGNKYQAIIKTLKTNAISLLIREVYRSPRFKNQPSFPDTLGTSLTYSSDHIIVPLEADEGNSADGEEEETLE